MTRRMSGIAVDSLNILAGVVIEEIGSPLRTSRCRGLTPGGAVPSLALACYCPPASCSAFWISWLARAENCVAAPGGTMCPEKAAASKKRFITLPSLSR